MTTDDPMTVRRPTPSKTHSPGASMRQIKHTPGPWSVGPKGGCVVSASPIPGIREGTGHDDVEHYGGYLIGESIWRKEDAQLIASAPDLLAVLIELTDIEGPLPGNRDWHANVLAAIAKATGAA